MLPTSFKEGVILLHELPNIGIMAVIVGTLLLAVIMGPLITHRILGLQASDKRSSGALDAFKAIAAWAALVIVFSLVQAQGNLRLTEADINKEASAFNNMDRVLLRSGDPTFVNLRPALHAYGRAVIDKEWPLLAHGGRAPEANNAFAVLSRAGYAFQATNSREEAMFGQYVQRMNELSDLRNTRLNNSDLSLPSLFWATICMLLLLMVVLASLVTPAPERTVQVLGMIIALGILLSQVVIVDLPFSGETSASPGPIERMLAYSQTRD